MSDAPQEEIVRRKGKCEQQTHLNVHLPRNKEKHNEEEQQKKKSEEQLLYRDTPSAHISK